MSTSLLQRHLFVIGVLILIGVNVALSFLLWAEIGAASREQLPVPPSATVVVTATAPPATSTSTSTPSEPSPTSLPPATSTALPPTITPTVTATTTVMPTPEPLTVTQPVTAVVNAVAGLRLRAEPNGAEIGYVSDGTVVTLLPGREELGGQFWQQVRTGDGREGWVAAEYLDYSEE